jgi:hypothetical protein
MKGLAQALEFNARSGPQLDLARWLKRQGIDFPHILNITGPIVEHDIIIFEKGLFEFARPGAINTVRAIVHVAFDEDAEMPVDLVAWTREQPSRIFRRLGAAQAIGVDQLFNPASYFAGRPLRVHRTALAWLAVHCDGVVLLDTEQFEIASRSPRFG